MVSHFYGRGGRARVRSSRFATTVAVLPAAVVAASDLGLLVVSAAPATRLASCCLPAVLAAIDVAAVAPAADPNQRPALGAREVPTALVRPHPRQPWTGSASGRTLGLSYVFGASRSIAKSTTGSPGFIPPEPGTLRRLDGSLKIGWLVGDCAPPLRAGYGSHDWKKRRGTGGVSLGSETLTIE